MMSTNTATTPAPTAPPATTGIDITASAAEDVLALTSRRRTP